MSRQLFQQSYLFTPWYTVLLEKLTGLQLVKKFPAFHGNRRFIDTLTRVHHLSLSWARPIQSIYPHPNSWSSILILSTHLRVGLLRVFPTIYEHLISQNFLQSKPSCSMGIDGRTNGRKEGWTDRRTDMTKLIVAFRNSTNARKNH